MPYTCDTYSTFTDDNFIESEIEYLNDNSKKEITYDDLDIEHNRKGIVEGIGEILASFLVDNYEFINNCKVDSVSMPNFYNYTTDTATMEVDCDYDEILAYCKEYQNEYDEYLINEARYYLRVPVEELPLIFYIQNYSNEEIKNDYLMTVYDEIDNIYSEHTKITIK